MGGDGGGGTCNTSSGRLQGHVFGPQRVGPMRQREAPEGEGALAGTGTPPTNPLRTTHTPWDPADAPVRGAFKMPTALP